MFAQFGASFAAVYSACERHSCFKFSVIAAAAAASLAGCVPATVPAASRDPADPAARIAAVGYRPVTAPYASLRPSQPAPWRERNDGAAPSSKPDR